VPAIITSSSVEWTPSNYSLSQVAQGWRSSHLCYPDFGSTSFLGIQYDANCNASPLYQVSAMESCLGHVVVVVEEEEEEHDHDHGFYLGGRKLSSGRCWRSISRLQDKATTMVKTTKQVRTIKKGIGLDVQPAEEDAKGK